MKNTFKTIAALLIIGMSFTACTKEEVQPSPISFSYPPSYQMSLNEVLDSASGSYLNIKKTFNPTMGDTFVRYNYLDFEVTDSMTMLISDPESNGGRGELVDIVGEDFGFISNIQEHGTTTVVIYELEYDRITVFPDYPNTERQAVYNKLK